MIQEISIHSENVRLLGRMDETQTPIYLDWTGSGFEVLLKGHGLWAEMAATQDSTWVCSTADGMPISRFLVEKERRWYPIVYHMHDEYPRTVALHKETQAGETAVAVYGLRVDGELLPLPEPSMRIEFVGDSIASAEGTLAPHGDSEYSELWFSSVGNFTHACCKALKAEGRVLSRGGYGVAWNWLCKRYGNMADSYEKTVGLLNSPAGVERGCQKDYDFTKWKADVVVVRLLANDVGGLRIPENAGCFAERKEELIEKCVAFTKKIRRYNPAAKIVWVLPGVRKSMPEIAVEAVNRASAEVDNVYFCPLPDYEEADAAARNHPNAAFHERYGRELARFISVVTNRQDLLNG